MSSANSEKRSGSRKRRRRCKHSILWVDDDPNVSAAIARRLLRHSIRVIPASDGMQGYWLALTRSPDAVVTDLRMPRWEGRELVECLRQNDATRAIPTIVLSGYASDLEEEYRKRNDIRAVLEKPVDVQTLLTTLRDCWLSRNPLRESKPVLTRV